MKHQNLEFKWMCLLFLALLLSPPLLWGQNHSIKGQIVDAKSNEPLIGVNITVEGTSNGTISDIDGRFTLSVAANYFEIFSWNLKKMRGREEIYSSTGYTDFTAFRNMIVIK